MREELVLGLDIGTTSVKTVLFQHDGTVVAEREEPVKTDYPQEGWVEQNPDEIKELSILAIKGVLEKAGVEHSSITSVGISCAMHSLICVGEDGTALSNALIWSDGRSSEQAERLVEEEKGQEIFLKTGTPIHPMSPFMKLIWMNENQYDAYKQAAYFMSVKEYLLYHWFGKRVIDYSMASATGLFNPATLQWEEVALKLAHIRKEQLSNIVPPTEVLNGLPNDIASRMGLAPNIPFVIGSADGQLANLGIGAILPGEVAITVGTSGAVRQFSKGAHINPKRETFCYSFSEDYTIIGGPTNNGGIALQWLKDVMNDQGSYEDFLAKAEQVSPGSDGMIFIPYINGERAPIWDQQATGQFTGMKITHKQEHFVRAVLEGITFNLYQIEQALSRLAGESERIYVNGGLARSPIWLQMLADVFGKEVFVAQTHHSSAWGAAWTALVAIGEAESFEAIKESVVLGEAITPNKERHRIYQKAFQRYGQLTAQFEQKNVSDYPAK